MAKIISLKDGEMVEITAIEEVPEFNNDVTDHPVEDGSSVSDHIARRPGEFPISGVVAGDSAPSILATLRRWRNERHLMRYVGRNILDNYVIRELRTEHDVSVRDGFRFRLMLKEVRVVKPAIVELVKQDPATVSPSRTTTQAKPVEDKGRQQPVVMRLQEERFTQMVSNIEDKYGPIPAADTIKEQTRNYASIGRAL